MGFVLAYTITSELYPTILRSQATSVLATIARIFTLGVLYIPTLSTIWAPLPGLVLGVPAVFASISSLTLDETRGQDLPQNLSDGLQIHLKKSSAVKDVNTRPVML